MDEYVKETDWSGAKAGCCLGSKELEDEGRSWPVSYDLEMGKVKGEDFVDDYNSEAEG